MFCRDCGSCCVNRPRPAQTGLDALREADALLLGDAGEDGKDGLLEDSMDRRYSSR